MRGFLRLYDMASPQKENGFTPIAHELLEAFILAKFTEYQRKIVLFIWRKTYGWNKKEDDISNSQFVIGTGINKGNVSRTIKELKNAKVVISRDNKLKVNKNYEEWKVISRDNKSYLTGKQKVISTATTIESSKDIIQKKDIPPTAEKLMKPQKDENDFSDVGEKQIQVDTQEEEDTETPRRIAKKGYDTKLTNPLLLWAIQEKRDGRPYTSPMKQKAKIAAMLAAGWTPDEIKAKWKELEKDNFWKDRIDFAVVAQQLDKTAKKPNSKYAGL